MIGASRDDVVEEPDFALPGARRSEVPGVP